MELTTIILIAFVVFLTGVSKSGFAGALGVFAVPLLLLKLPATQAIALMLPILIIADIFSVKSYWKKWDKGLLITLIPGAAFGIFIAHAVVTLVSLAQLKIIVALICIVFAIRSLLFARSHLKLLDNRIGAALMSSLSGFTSTLVHAGGPPLMIYLTAKGLSPQKFVATASAFFAAMNIFKLIGFSFLGILQLNELSTALLFLPFAFLGNWSGLLIREKLDERIFLRVMNFLLLTIGVINLF